MANLAIIVSLHEAATATELEAAHGYCISGNCSDAPGD